MENLAVNKFSIPLPEVIRIEPSSVCNLSCTHCPTGTVKLRRGIMTTETFNIALKYIESHSNNIRVVVMYHGGEPFLNKNAISMIKQIKAAGIPFVKTVSNGMLLKKSLLNELILSGLDSLEISLDGKSPIENDIIRQRCCFEEVARNVKSLVEQKKLVSSNIPKIIIATTQFLEEQVDKYFMENASPCVPEFLLAEFRECIENADIEIKSTHALEWPHMNIVKEMYHVRELKRVRSNWCDEVYSTLTIRWNGDVVPCCSDLTSRYITGNIHEETIEKIWNNEKYINIRKSIHEREWNVLCGNCSQIGNKHFLVLNRGFLGK